MTPTTAQPIRIVSFGYLHGDAPQTDIPPFDLRRSLFDPAHVPSGDMLDMTGLDVTVRRFVFGTTGALDILADAKAQTLAKAADRPVSVAFGCAGGRHRSVVLAQALHDQLQAAGHTVLVQHLHVHLPRVIKAVTP